MSSGYVRTYHMVQHRLTASLEDQQRDIWVGALTRKDAVGRLKQAGVSEAYRLAWVLYPRMGFAGQCAFGKWRRAPEFEEYFK